MTEVATLHYDAQQRRGVGQRCGIGLFVGRKSEMLTSENLSELFDADISVTSDGSTYHMAIRGV